MEPYAATAGREGGGDEVQISVWKAKGGASFNYLNFASFCRASGAPLMGLSGSSRCSSSHLFGRTPSYPSRTLLLELVVARTFGDLQIRRVSDEIWRISRDSDDSRTTVARWLISRRFQFELSARERTFFEAMYSFIRAGKYRGLRLKRLPLCFPALYLSYACGVCFRGTFAFDISYCLRRLHFNTTFNFCRC